MAMYLVNFASILDWECFDDCPGEHAECIEHLAHPSGIIVEDIDIAKAEFIEQLADELEGDDGTTCPRPWRWERRIEHLPTTNCEYLHLIDADNNVAGVVAYRLINIIR